MGAYAYCHKCDAGMDEPTLREAFTNEWACHQCGRDHAVGDEKRADLLCDLEERLANIEQLLGVEKS